MNIGKTEIMVVGGDQHELIMECEQRIKGCTEYGYLGIPITANGTVHKAAQERNQQEER